MIKFTLLSNLKNTSIACIVALLCCAPLCAMEPVHAIEQVNNQEFFAPQELSALTALATISVAHHATQQAPAKKFTCPTCEKSLSSNQSLTDHQRTHTGEKPFKCKFHRCTYAGNRKCDLTRHQRSHTGEKPFKCDFPGCAYAAARKAHLTSHQLRIHHLEPKRTLDENINLKESKRYRPEDDAATETELEEGLS